MHRPFPSFRRGRFVAALWRVTLRDARWWRGVGTTVAGVVALAAGAACTPSIGDGCENNIDCSTLGDRICDTTQPGGYCTVFNCEPDSCTDEAVCVSFNNELDAACGTAGAGRQGRFGKTFCMRRCDETSDCREGYVCQRPVERAARVVDADTTGDDPQATKICIAVGSASPLPTEAPNACFPNDDGPPLTPYEPPGSGGGGGAGDGGSGGAGDGGAGGVGGGSGGPTTGGAGGAGGGSGGQTAGAGGAAGAGGGSGGTGGS
ncbi:MAG: hypothetical protein AAF928_06435 [Myxococcota bacterium]